MNFYINVLLCEIIQPSRGRRNQNISKPEEITILFLTYNV
jgi:hypothetical protein